jgi:hypothetical protein
MRRHAWSFGLAMALACGLAPLARAEVHVEGSLSALRVSTGREAIADVLSAFAPLNVKYRSAVPLDAAAGAAYSGSLGQVMSRLLDGYNYVIRKDQDTTEIIVFGRRGAVAIPPPAPTPAPAKGIVSRWK